MKQAQFILLHTALVCALLIIEQIAQAYDPSASSGLNKVLQ
jgi:hypothetical protein